MGACRMPHAARRKRACKAFRAVAGCCQAHANRGGRGALPALANVCRSAALVPCRALGAGDQQAA